MLIIMMVALPDFFFCARNHSNHFTYVASFNQSQQLTDVDSIFYILEIRKAG